MADFRDEWVNNPYVDIDFETSGSSVAASLRVSSFAACGLLVNDFRRCGRKLHPFFSTPKEKIVSITNGYDEWDFRNIYFPKDKNDAFTITYSGLLYCTEQRNMAPLFAAVQELIQEGKIPSEKIKFRIMGNSEQDNTSLAKKYQLEDNIHLTGYSPHQKALQLCANSDLLVLLIGDEARFKGVYTGKVFEYLRCGKPILAIAPKSGVVDNLLQETGHGKAITSKEREAIKSFILDIQAWESSPEKILPYQ